MKVIEFVIDASGEIKIDAVGFKGKSCLDATASYEKALGARDQDRKIKPEMHQEAKHDLRH